MTALGAAEVLLRLASLAKGPVIFDVGPSTGAYHHGFTPSEERPPTTFRWSRDHAVVELPLQTTAAQGTLTIRVQGFRRQAVTTHFLLGGRLVASFPARSGRFHVVTLPVAIPAGPLRIDIRPEGPADPGIAVDWIRLEGARVRLPFSVWGPRLLVGGLCLLALLAGFSPASAFGAALALALAQAAWAALDPFALAHVSSRIAVPALLLAALALMLFRSRPRARWVMLLVLASYLTKGAGLFHPSYFYNDVRNNRRFVLALGEPDGTRLERRHSAQVRIGVAYPRVVAGKKYAFPYSPVFFLPFTLLRPEPLVIDEAMKQAVVALAATEVLLAFWLAGLVFGPGAGLAAALIAATLPILMSRLMLGLWATLGGHFFDTLMIGAALPMLAAPGRLRAVLPFAAAAQASLLTYVASLFNVSLFAGLLALLARHLATRVLFVWAGAVAVTLGLLYSDFVVTFVTEIGPAVLAGHSTEPHAAGQLGRVADALGRMRIFYGFGYPALMLAGLVVLRRHGRPRAVPAVAAYTLSFAALMLLRCLAGGLFDDLKEMEFVAPLVALLAGASLERLWAHGHAGRVASVLAVLWLLAFSVGRYLDYVSTWTALAQL